MRSQQEMTLNVQINERDTPQKSNKICSETKKNVLVVGFCFTLLRRWRRFPRRLCVGGAFVLTGGFGGLCLRFGRGPLRLRLRSLRGIDRREDYGRLNFYFTLRGFFFVFLKQQNDFIVFCRSLFIKVFLFFRSRGGHIKLVFTTNPLPVQNWRSSLRHSATARLVSRVQGTR